MTLKIKPGTILQPIELFTVHSERVPIPDPRGIVHLQFRRFAGCPVCNLHLRSFVRRHHEILAASVREVVLFHSTEEELRPHVNDLPFAVVADPGKKLYLQFGVECGVRSLLDPRVWMPILVGIARSLCKVILGQAPWPSLNPHGGRFGLPADFLIGGDGRVLARKYGSHAYDQWSVDELLTLANQELSPSSQHPDSASACFAR